VNDHYIYMDGNQGYQIHQILMKFSQIQQIRPDLDFEWIPVNFQWIKPISWINQQNSDLERSEFPSYVKFLNPNANNENK
jgi:hypothetical protein